MTPTLPQTKFAESHDDWRLLRIYTYYRLLLAALLLVLFSINPNNPLLGSENPKLFLISGAAYLLIAVSNLVISQRLRSEPRLQAFFFVLIDIIFITLIMHANGGPTAQLSLLYLVMVAAGNILLPDKRGPLIAAIASIAVLYEQFYFTLNNYERISSANLVQASILGISFFAIALFSQLISHRFRQVEALALQKSLEVESLQQLNEQIINRMHTGVLVVNPERELLLYNNAAQQLLGINDIHKTDHLKNISGTIDAGLLAWRQNLMIRPLVFKNQATYPEINVSYMQLDIQNKESNILIFLENTAQMTQKAQQLKLASLGRLTASIAHEIRNPLGAISHAAQLLIESEDIKGPDARLLKIIEQHCVRVNNIVETVLQLSRRQKSTPQLLNLKVWLDNFIDEYHQTNHQQKTIIFQSTDNILIRFDTDQLYQVIYNMVNNAFRYSAKNGHHTIELMADVDDLTQLPYLEIYDLGPGVALENQKNLFEPFFTTEKNGTGLGLYLSKELCEANQAHLDYLPQPEGACFRITFSHPNRLI
ncbi:ATP-binding protein [uncultured Agitococcus sp.]|uniref:sensor histidine kinase n=1 Tax=uncultured Agitococcus sp. TaxID=1506599 RepID=UPI00260C755E|nr:ATP-binding protein [uncultured Agitococcus sp.]